jgi:hypothetical protein
MVQAFRKEMMKSLVLLFALALPGLTTAVWAEDALPVPEKFAHYEAMLKRSPFAVATAGAPVGATPDFARDLYVANAAHLVEGDFVTIASTTNKELKEYLSSRETVHGYSISSIQWSDKVGETKVTITKDGQFATLTFNEALLSQAIQNPVPTTVQPHAIPGRPLPGRPNANVQTQIQRPMPVPQIPTPPPHTRPIIRRNAQPHQPVQQQPSEQSSAIDDSEFDDP